MTELSRHRSKAAYLSSGGLNLFWETNELFSMDGSGMFSRPSINHYLGCSFPVSSADFWLYLRKFCGQADRGGLAGQRREFKFHRKSAAQTIIEYKEQP